MPIRLLMSISFSPAVSSWSSLGSLTRFQFWPVGLSDVGIWPLSAVTAHESGSGD